MAEPASPAPSPHGRLRRLECLRGAATAYVMVHHFVHVNVAPTHPSVALPFKLGQLVVLVFFVVSGFVIYYATAAAKREPDLRDYLIRRFRRIYPPFLLALFFTWLVQCAIEGGLADPVPRELLGNLLMLQDENTDSWFRPYLANSSLWSLSYEWAFYLLFIPVFWLLRDRPKAQLPVVAGAAVIAFGVHQFVANQFTLFLMYFPIWWSGIELAREYVETGTVSVRRQLAPFLVIVGMAGLWVIPVAQARAAGVELVMWKHPVIELRHFITAAFILGFAQVWKAAGWRGFYQVLGPFERIAPISYGLYMIHKPVIHLANARPLIGNVWAELIWMIPLVFGLAWVIEKWIQQYVIRWMPTAKAKS